MDQPHPVAEGNRRRTLSAAAPPETLSVLGCRVDRVDMNGAVDRIEGYLRSNAPAHVVTLGAEMANRASTDASYRGVLNAADLVVADTVGIVAAARLLGKPLRERVAGIELLLRVCERAVALEQPVFVLGAAPGVAAQACAELAKRYPGLRIAGNRDGYFDDAESAAVCALIRESGARLVFVALGFPRQEQWIRNNLANLGPAVCIGVGGSFDVLAGRLPRAPLAVRRIGLEWLYRLAREPRRFRRQLALPVFAARVLRQATFGPR